MNLDQTKRALMIISGAYPHCKTTPESVEVWHEMLGLVPADRVFAALRAHIATSVWEPRIAEIINAIAESALPDQAKLSADEAYQDLDHPFAVSVNRELASRYGHPTTWLTADNIWRHRYIHERYEAFRVSLTTDTRRAVRDGTLDYSLSRDVRLKASGETEARQILGDLGDSIGFKIQLNGGPRGDSRTFEVTGAPPQKKTKLI